MSSLIARIRFSLPAAAIVAAVLATAVSAQGNPDAKRASCDTFARLSEVQTDANEKYNCNLSGPEWITSRRAHYDWCMTHRRDDLIDVLRYRAVELQKCFNTLGDYDDENYDRDYRRRF